MKSLTKNSKGQMVFEFIIAAVLFISIVIFVLNMLNTNVAMYTSGYFVYNLENKATTASESLVKLTGGVGLAKDWPTLDPAKISNLNSQCNTANGYSELLGDLNLIDNPGYGRPYYLRIEINSDSGQILLCEPLATSKIPEGVSSSHIQRFGIVNGEIATVDLWIW